MRSSYLMVLVLLAGTALVQACGGGGGGGGRGGSGPQGPAAPGNLSASTVSMTRIDLAWTRGSSDTTGYTIERSTNGTTFTALPATISAATGTDPGVTFSDTGLSPATTYWYQVRAINARGTSTASNRTNATTFTVATVAGSGGTTTTHGQAGSADSPAAATDGTSARFTFPYGITTDGTYLYIADTMNHEIRKVDRLTGFTSTLAGAPTVTGSSDGTGSSARFNYPSGITWDGSTLYVADTLNHTIRTVDRITGAVTTVYGTAGVRGAVNAAGTAASFNQPVGLVSDGTTLYVADSLNHTVREIAISAGTVTTLAGAALVSGSTDSSRAAARFNQPFGLALVSGGAGTLIVVTDSGNNTVRTIDAASGLVSTLAGTAGSSGSADGTGGAARFNQPTGIASDVGNTVYVTDTLNHTIRQIIVSTGSVSTIAGTAGAEGYDLGVGAAARFNHPFGITYIPGAPAMLYVADTFNHAIRSIELATRAVNPVAGATPETAMAQIFNHPNGIAVSPNGSKLFVADTDNGAIRSIDLTTGSVSILAGSGFYAGWGSVDAVGTSALFNRPFGVATDGAFVYVADTDNHTIRKIDLVSTYGSTTTIAGAALQYGNSDGIGDSARFFHPGGITTTSTGTYVYVTDSHNQTVRRVDKYTGEVATIAGYPGQPGFRNGVGPSARFNSPVGITTDGAFLYVADMGNNAIRRIDIATHAVTTFAGSGLQGHLDGSGPSSRFFWPYGVVHRGSGLYVADTRNSVIRKIDLQSGEVTTISGTINAAGQGMNGFDDGFSSSSKFYNPQGIATDGVSLYIADTNNHAIRKIQ